MPDADQKETAAYALKRLQEKGCDDAIVEVSEETSSQIKFSNNKISITQHWDSLTMGIFASLNKKIVTTTLKDFTTKKINHLLDQLLTFTKKTKPNDDYHGIAQGPSTYTPIKDSYDKKVTAADPVDIVHHAITTALDNGAKRTTGLLNIAEQHVHLLTTGNIQADDKSTLIHLSIRSLIDKHATGHTTETSRTLKPFKPERAAEESATIAKDSTNPTPATAGTYDVLFTPLAFANLLSLTGSATSIFNVEAGLSFLHDQLNKHVASNIVNLREDPTLPNSPGSTPFDAEGVPSQNVPLITRGILKNYLHNTSTAKKYHTKTTASAGLIAPEPRNLILEKGDQTKEELIQHINHGLYVTNIWYTRFQNHTTGEFSTIPRDGTFLIHNGKITHPVRELRISDTMPNILNNISHLGNDAKQILSWETDVPTTTPHTIVKNVTITKPTEKTP